MRRIWLWCAATGCGVDVAEEMERSLVQTNEALAMALIATDVPWSAFGANREGLRHQVSGPCPVLLTDVLDGPDFTATLDYGDSGCRPLSGLVPIVMSGKSDIVRTSAEVEASLTDLDLQLAYPIVGQVTAMGHLDFLEVQGELTATDDVGDLTATLDFSIDLPNEQAVLNGQVRLDGVEGKSTVRFDDVEIRYPDILGECPSPHTGKATVSGDKDVVIDFGVEQAGTVVATRGNRTSENVSLCTFESWMFGARRLE